MVLETVSDPSGATVQVARGQTLCDLTPFDRWAEELPSSRALRTVINGSGNLFSPHAYASCCTHAALQNASLEAADADLATSIGVCVSALRNCTDDAGATDAATGVLRAGLNGNTCDALFGTCAVEYLGCVFRAGAAAPTSGLRTCPWPREVNLLSRQSANASSDDARRVERVLAQHCDALAQRLRTASGCAATYARSLCDSTVMTEVTAASAAAAEAEANSYPAVTSSSGETYQTESQPETVDVADGAPAPTTADAVVMRSVSSCARCERAHTADATACTCVEGTASVAAFNVLHARSLLAAPDDDCFRDPYTVDFCVSAARSADHTSSVYVQEAARGDFSTHAQRENPLRRQLADHNVTNSSNVVAGGLCTRPNRKTNGCDCPADTMVRKLLLPTRMATNGGLTHEVVAFCLAADEAVFQLGPDGGCQHPFGLGFDCVCDSGEDAAPPLSLPTLLYNQTSGIVHEGLLVFCSGRPQRNAFGGGAGTCVAVASSFSGGPLAGLLQTAALATMAQCATAMYPESIGRALVTPATLPIGRTGALLFLVIVVAGCLLLHLSVSAAAGCKLRQDDEKLEAEEEYEKSRIAEIGSVALASTSEQSRSNPVLSQEHTPSAADARALPSTVEGEDPSAKSHGHTVTQVGDQSVMMLASASRVGKYSFGHDDSTCVPISLATDPTMAPHERTVSAADAPPPAGDAWGSDVPSLTVTVDDETAAEMGAAPGREVTLSPNSTGATSPARTKLQLPAETAAPRPLTNRADVSSVSFVEIGGSDDDGAPNVRSNDDDDLMPVVSGDSRSMAFTPRALAPRRLPSKAEKFASSRGGLQPAQRTEEELARIQLARLAVAATEVDPDDDMAPCLAWWLRGMKLVSFPNLSLNVLFLAYSGICYESLRLLVREDGTASERLVGAVGLICAVGLLMVVQVWGFQAGQRREQLIVTHQDYGVSIEHYSAVLRFWLPKSYWRGNTVSMAMYGAFYEQWGKTSVTWVSGSSLLKALLMSLFAVVDVDRRWCKVLLAVQFAMLLLFALFYAIARPFRRPPDNAVAALLSFLTSLLVLKYLQPSLNINLTLLFYAIVGVAIVSLPMMVGVAILEICVLRPAEEAAILADANMPTQVSLAAQRSFFRAANETMMLHSVSYAALQSQSHGGGLVTSATAAVPMRRFSEASSPSRADSRAHRRVEL